MEVLLILTVGAMNILCLLFGVRIGQAVNKGEKVEMPTISPKKIIQEHKASKKAEMEQDKYDTILQNIECYDGTGKGQKDVGR